MLGHPPCLLTVGEVAESEAAGFMRKHRQRAIYFLIFRKMKSLGRVPIVEDKQMRPCWRDLGLTEKGAVLADSVLPELQTLVDRVGGEVVRLALAEATFRRHELPLRTPEYRRRYLKENE
jgi:hypothetical protein